SGPTQALPVAIPVASVLWSAMTAYANANAQSLRSKRSMLRPCHRATAALVLTALFPTIAAAQNPRAGVVTTLEGTVTARRVANPQPVSLKFKDDVFMQDR